MNLCAMIFPGQGSQKVGMLSALARTYPLVKETFLEASEILTYNLWNLIQHGPSEELNKTWKTQPALLAASVAIWRVWIQQGGNIPNIMAGHSLGEYSALVCSGGLDFITAIKLVELRGTLMQESVQKDGVMYTIIGLNHDIICSICEEETSQGNIVFPVSFNTPEQVVIAGYKESVEKAGIRCKFYGAKRIVQLPISVPSHCILMKPASYKLEQILESIKFSIPNVPVINNVDVKIENDPFYIRKALVRQLYSPVRWMETINYLENFGVKNILEAGPGNILTGLNKRIVIKLSSTAVNNPVSLAAALKN